MTSMTSHSTGVAHGAVLVWLLYVFLDKGKDAENLRNLVWLLYVFLDKGKDAENLRKEFFYFI